MYRETLRRPYLPSSRTRHNRLVVARAARGGKAEHIAGKENPRYVVSSLESDEWRRRVCTRNSTVRAATWKPDQGTVSVVCGRVSAETMRATSCAVPVGDGYTLVSGLRVGSAGDGTGAGRGGDHRTRCQIGALVASAHARWLSPDSSYNRGCPARFPSRLRLNARRRAPARVFSIPRMAISRPRSSCR